VYIEPYQYICFNLFAFILLPSPEFGTDLQEKIATFSGSRCGTLGNVAFTDGADSPTVQGFLNLDKPKGWTSHDCVARVRRLLRQKRVGHAGTLDPAAMGVLPIAIGRATRLLQYLPSDKAYRATIRFGVTTSTDDLEGEILQSKPPHLTLEQVEAYLPEFTGKITQIPPIYSAIQVQGQRLYDLARRGEPIDVPSRTVEVYRIGVVEWRSLDYPELVVDIECGGGTYIRSIARDLGVALGTGATLAALQRTMSSGFSLSESMTLDDLAEQVAGDRLVLIPPIDALQHLPSMTLTPESARRWCLGQRLAPADYPSRVPDTYRIYGKDGQFLGIGTQAETEDGDILKPKLVFESAAVPSPDP
jgi:tRNA pseudouridine55 synthase